MKTQNESGPKSDHCGTPLVISTSFELKFELFLDFVFRSGELFSVFKIINQ